MIEHLTCHASDGHIVHGTLTLPHEADVGLLLVHGITADRSEWGYYTKLCAALAEEGAATLAIDYRGHGESSMSRDRLLLSGVLLDTEAAWTELRRRLPDDAIGICSGNSFGGGMAYLFGMRRPDVAAVILTMPVVSYVDDLARVNPSWREAAADDFIPYASTRLTALIASEFYYFDGEIAGISPSKDFIVLHGDADADVPVESSREFVAKRPRGQLVELRKMDHCWTAPGDWERLLPASAANQDAAVARTVEALASLIRRLR